MKAILDNAYRRLGLAAGTSVAEVRQRRDEFRRARKEGREAPPEAECADAVRRLEDLPNRLRETVFGGGPDGAARDAAEATAALVAGGGTAAAWLEAHRRWEALARDEGFRRAVRAWVAAQRPTKPVNSVVDDFLAALPADALLANVELGTAALGRGEVDEARVHVQVAQGAPVGDSVRRMAVGAIVRKVAEAAEKEVAEVERRLAPFEADVRPPADVESRLDEAAARVAQAVAAHLASLEALAPSAADRPRDALAGLYRRIAVLGARAGAGADVTRRRFEAARGQARDAALRRQLEEDLRDPEWAVRLAGALVPAYHGSPERARRALERLRHGASPERAKAVDAILAEPRNLAAPVKRMPSLSTLNGVGGAFWGRRNESLRDGTYVTTHCACVLFLPVFPMAAYLVRSTSDGQWNVFAQVPLSRFARLWRNAVGLAVPVALAAWIGWAAWNSSAPVQERRALQEARRAVAAGQPDEALRALQRVDATEDAGRARERDALAGEAIRQWLGTIRAPEMMDAFLAGPAAALADPARDAAWFTEDTDAAALRAMEALPVPALNTGGPPGSPARAAFERAVFPPARFLAWACEHSPRLRTRRYEVVRTAALRLGGPSLAELALRWRDRDAGPAPEELLTPLETSLRTCRHSAWTAQFETFRRDAGATRAEAVLHAWLRPMWLGAAGAEELDALDRALVPPPLARLVAAARLADPEKRLEALAAAAAPEGLPEDVAAVHRAGHARLMAVTLRALYDLDPERHPLSEAGEWAGKAADHLPADAGIALLALQCRLAAGDLDGAIALGERHRDSDAVAAWFGVACARAGRLEDAERALAPWVARHLDPFLKAYGEWSILYDGLSTACWSDLREGRADQVFVQRLNALPREQAEVEANAWVERSVESNPRLVELEAAWQAHADARFAARELAMVRLARGREMPAGPARQAQLAEAERLFLALRKAVERTDEDDLALARVYLWMGKEKEAAEVVAGLEKGGNPEMLVELGDLMRGVGRDEAARGYLERAWKELPAERKERAAQLRAIAGKSLEDRLEWLQRCDARNAYVKATLAETRAGLCIRDGKYAEAEPMLREAAAYYAQFGDDSTALNNASLLHLSLWRAGGDPASLREALRLQRRSLELDPEDPIVVVNTVRALELYGWQVLGGRNVRAASLHEDPASAWMDYASPAPAPAEAAARVREQGELREAADLGVRAATLSPESDEGWEAQLVFAERSRDLDRLRRLRETIESAPPAQPEEAARAARYRRGEYSDEEKAQARTGWDRQQRAVAEAAAAGHAPTHAYALCDAGLSALAMARVGGEASLLDRAVDLCEEAVRTFDAPAPRLSLMWTLGDRMARDLAAADPAFRSAAAEARDAWGLTLVWLWLQRHPDAAPRIRALPDAARAATLAAARLDSGTCPADAADWLALQIAGHERAAEAARRLKQEGTELDGARVRFAIDASSSGTAALALGAAAAFGDAAVEGELEARARAAGLLKGLVAEK